MVRPRLFQRDDDYEVTCVACGETLPRHDAREYDKYGDRFTRDGKTFEYLCKPCHREYSHLPRDGLESTLIEARAGEVSRESFFARYFELEYDDTQTTSD